MSPPFGFHQVWPTNSVAGQSQPTNQHQINDFCSNNNNNNNKEDIDEEASFEQFPVPSRLGNFLKSTIEVGVGRSSHSTEPFQGKMAATLAYRVLLSASASLASIQCLTCKWKSCTPFLPPFIFAYFSNTPHCGLVGQLSVSSLALTK